MTSVRYVMKGYDIEVPALHHCRSYQVILGESEVWQLRLDGNLGCPGQLGIAMCVDNSRWEKLVKWKAAEWDDDSMAIRQVMAVVGEGVSSGVRGE